MRNYQIPVYPGFWICCLIFMFFKVGATGTPKMVVLLRITKSKVSPKFVRTLCLRGKYDTVRDLFIHKPVGNTATLKGWVERIRVMKTYTFINVKDGSCPKSVQVVVSQAMRPERITVGSSVSTSGTVGTDHRGNVEVRAENIAVLGQCDFADGFPFTPGEKHGFDYVRQFLHHRPKLTFFSALLRLRYSVTLAVHKYFRDNDFVGVHTPVLTSNDCEGAGETFLIRPSSEDVIKNLEVEGKSSDEVFFNQRTFLTVSGQFHLETLSRAIPKVYTFGPVFRAENSKSRLHLSEFYMIEAEEAFIDSLKDILKTMEDLIKILISSVLSECDQDLKFILENNETDSKSHLETLKYILDKPFAVMSYSEAKEILNQNSKLIKNTKLHGFTKEEELFLVKYNRYVPIFVINWPKNVKPFYVKACNETTEEVQAVDLLAPVVGELCGGSMREDNYEILYNKLEEMDNLEQYNWYLELRKFGNTPTGGFGMGFERFLQFALNIQNIRDTIPFPRWPHSLQL